MRGVRAFGDIARAVLRRKKFYQKGRYGPLRKAWQDLVGEAVARRTHIRSFARGKLVIEVSSATLLHELNNFMEAQLLRELQATAAGRDIASLRFRLENGERRRGDEGQ